MSVNLQMDGNTYEDAIKILVGGKEINISESGSGVVTGEFTPSTQSYEYTLETGMAEIHGIMVILKAPVTSNVGYRYICAIFIDFDNQNRFFTVGSNTAGTAPFDTVLASSYSRLQFSVSGGTINFKTFNENASGQFCTNTYKWIAW